MKRTSKGKRAQPSEMHFRRRHRSREQPEQRKMAVWDSPKAPRTYEAAPQKEFEYWDFPDMAAVREAPPSSITDADKLRLKKLLELGNDPETAGDEELFVNLGLDFGTSSTKMIVRLPYDAGEPTIAIPAPDPCRSNNAPYLWQTTLWLAESGAFFPWPEPRATVLKSLKQGLIQGRSEMALPGFAHAFAVNRAQAGVAYLAFVIRYVRGWLLRYRSHLFRGRKPVWFVNLGMPTASYDDLKFAEPYRRIAAAALLLAQSGHPVTVEKAQFYLDDPEVAKAGSSVDAAEELGVAVFPEAAAEMTGFAKSTRGAPGLYLLVDVGAMTLDACMFRLNKNAKTGDLYAFMAAQVRPLGVDSFHWFKNEGKKEPEFIKQCDRALREVVWETKKNRDPKAENWNPGGDIPVFLAGGGAENSLHRNIVEALHPWLKSSVFNEGIRLLKLHVPKAIELAEPLEDFNRMAVAWGLSFPKADIGDIQAMRDIEDIPPPAVVDFSGKFISKDDV